jgi:hypothetical protein
MLKASITYWRSVRLWLAMNRYRILNTSKAGGILRSRSIIAADDAEAVERTAT